MSTGIHWGTGPFNPPMFAELAFSPTLASHKYKKLLRGKTKQKLNKTFPQSHNCSEQLGGLIPKGCLEAKFPALS